jgi:hypothetical protein
MNVNSVKNGASIYKSSDAKDRKALVQEDYSSKLNTKVDKVEISSEAKKLSEIQMKIDQRFYDRPEVIEQIAKNMLNDF